MSSRYEFNQQNRLLVSYITNQNVQGSYALEVFFIATHSQKMNLITHILSELGPSCSKIDIILSLDPVTHAEIQ